MKQLRSFKIEALIGKKEIYRLWKRPAKRIRMTGSWVIHRKLIGNQVTDIFQWFYFSKVRILLGKCILRHLMCTLVYTKRLKVDNF